MNCNDFYDLPPALAHQGIQSSCLPSAQDLAGKKMPLTEKMPGAEECTRLEKGCERGFSGGPLVRTLPFHCRGLRRGAWGSGDEVGHG